MTSFYDSHDYYKKMLELQEKLRKSEEERIRLEERFKILVQESHKRHDACINRLHLKYIEFLEEQRTRNERNHKLLEALDRVDNSLALMTAKTNKLNVLRKQYEAYLRRIYTVRSPSESIIGDTDIMVQNKDKYFRRNISEEQIHLPPEVKSVSSATMFRPSRQTSQSISPSTTKLTTSLQNMYYNNCQQNIIQSRVLSQQVNGIQCPFQMHPKLQENSIQQLPIQNLSPQVFQQGQPYYNNNNLHLVSHNFQVDPNLRIPHTLPHLQVDSLSQQTVHNFNKPSTERMETIRAAPHLVIPERINDNILQYKTLDISQSQTTPTTSQYCINPSLVMQSFRQQNGKILLGNLQTQIVNGNEVSSGFRTTPIITERNVPQTPLVNTHLNLAQQPLSSYLNYSLKNSGYCQKTVTDTPVCSSMTSHDHYMIKQHEGFTPKCLNNASAYQLSTGMKHVPVEEDEGRTTMTVGNELDRYIDKIRKLHNDQDVQSLKRVDHEQNTNDNDQNVTLLDDGLELSTKDEPEENLLKETEKVLALTDDLAIMSMNLNDVKEVEKECEDKNRNFELTQTRQNYKPISERNYTEISDMHEGRATSMACAKDKISSDIALRQPGLDSRLNIEKPEKQNSSSAGNAHILEQYEQEPLKMREDEHVDSVILSDKKGLNLEQNCKGPLFENIQEEEHSKGNIVYTAEQSKLEQYSFDSVKELEPWNLDYLEKQIKEIDSIVEMKDESVEKELIIDELKLNDDNVEQIQFENEAETAESQVANQDLREDTNEEGMHLNSAEYQLQQQRTEYSDTKKGFIDKNETEMSEISTSQHQEAEHHISNDNIFPNREFTEVEFDEQEKYDNEQKEEYREISHVLDENESNEQEVTTLAEEYDDQNNVEESQQIQNYPHNSEVEYTDVNKEYNYDQSTPYENNENQEYQEYSNQEYVQESNEQYEEYTSEQYDQYANNPENHDPNVQYQEDLNKQYSYTYDEQYDPNQVYETDINQLHDLDQTELTQEQVQNEEYKEQQEESKSQEIEESLEKQDVNQSKSGKLSSENEPKKKKDVIKSLLDSDTDSTIERNISNTESDFDFN